MVAVDDLCGTVVVEYPRLVETISVRLEMMALFFTIREPKLRIPPRDLAADYA